MLLYNWQKIYNASNQDVVEIVRILRMITYKQIPENTFDPIYKYHQMKFLGESYLVHPDVLVHNAHYHSYKNIASYIALASLRPYAEWVVSGKTSLELIHIPMEPEFILQTIATNDLLAAEDGNLMFLYENAESSETQH
jgi:hypothetical protein